MANIADIILQIESSGGTDPKRLTPNQYGALGSYQLRPAAVQDIKRVFPRKWGRADFRQIALNDKLSREAALDYLTVIEKYLVNKGIAPTMDALLAAYHSGMGNVRKGNLGKEGLSYLSKARALLQGR